MATHLLTTNEESAISRPWVQQHTVFGAVQRVRDILFCDRVFVIV